MISWFKRRYREVSDKVRAAVSDCEKTHAPGAATAGDLAWIALSIVVLVALSAISATWAVIWWRRIPWKPLATINSWGALMLAGIFAWTGVKLGEMAIREIRSRRKRVPR